MIVLNPSFAAEELLMAGAADEFVCVLSDLGCCFLGSDSAYEAPFPPLAAVCDFSAGIIPLRDLCSCINAAQPIRVLACLYPIVLRIVGICLPVGEEEGG